MTMANAVDFSGSARVRDALRELGAPVNRLIKDTKEGGVLSGAASMNNLMVPRYPGPAP